jgi:hypothetical protein
MFLMTVHLAGMWEIGWNTPIKEMDLWEMVVRDFEVDKFYMAPVSGISNPYVTERAFMENILEENDDLTFVFVDEKAKTELRDFLHPENVLYVFGRVGDGALYLKRDQDLFVRITTPANLALLWPHQIATLLLYDRMLKWQSPSRRT